MRNMGDTLPLFHPLPPAQLPNSNQYFNPTTDLCNSYRTKYVEFCGTDKTILATVMCNNQTGNQNPFSRIMLIDFTVPNNPYPQSPDNQILNHRLIAATFVNKGSGYKGKRVIL